MLHLESMKDKAVVQPAVVSLHNIDAGVVDFHGAFPQLFQINRARYLRIVSCIIHSHFLLTRCPPILLIIVAVHYIRATKRTCNSRTLVGTSGSARLLVSF